MFSNKYIYIYTTIMVVVVAALLALTATILQPFQASNIEIEKMQNILHAAGISSNPEDVSKLYNQSVQYELSVNTKGEVVARYSSDGKLIEGQGDRAFDIDMKLALEQGDDAIYPVFVTTKDGNTMYIVPLQGKGLWGAIWGYISFASDLNTVVGAIFNHKGETPGLGAEISADAFQKSFDGKKIFDDQGQFVSITVQKGGVQNYNGEPTHAVDAISGGTITSNGVTDMIKNCVEHYIPFFERIKAENKHSDTNSVSTDTIAVESTISLQGEGSDNSAQNANL